MQPNDAILAVGLCGEDLYALREVLVHSDWPLATSSTIAEAMHFVERNPVSVIFCERNLPDGSWRGLLEAVATRARPPNIIVTSRFADERLWAEVLNLGGYDVLARPLDRCEVLHALKSAWQSWHDHPGWAHSANALARLSAGCFEIG